MDGTVSITPAYAGVNPISLKDPLYRFFCSLKASSQRDGYCTPNLDKLATKTGKTVRTLNRWIRLLCDMGLLRVVTESGVRRRLYPADVPVLSSECPEKPARLTLKASNAKAATPTPPPAPAPQPAAVASIASIAPTVAPVARTSQVAQAAPQVSRPNPTGNAVETELRQAGVSADYAAIAAQKASQGQLRALLQAVRSRQDVRNIGGYLRRCIENQWFPQEQAAGRREDGTAERIKRDLEAAGQARQVRAQDVPAWMQARQKVRGLRASAGAT